MEIFVLRKSSLSIKIPLKIMPSFLFLDNKTNVLEQFAFNSTQNTMADFINFFTLVIKLRGDFTNFKCESSGHHRHFFSLHTKCKMKVVLVSLLSEKLGWSNIYLMHFKLLIWANVNTQTCFIFCWGERQKKSDTCLVVLLFLATIHHKTLSVLFSHESFIISVQNSWETSRILSLQCNDDLI